MTDESKMSVLNEFTKRCIHHPDEGCREAGVTIRPWVRATLGAATAAALGIRGVAAALALWRGDETAFLALPLGAILPALLVTALLLMGPTRTREGALMKLGTAVHLLLILAIPPAALHLALGLPVIFLVVELFETRMPADIRDPMIGMVLR